MMTFEMMGTGMLGLIGGFVLGIGFMYGKVEQILNKGDN